MCLSTRSAFDGRTFLRDWKPEDFLLIIAGGLPDHLTTPKIKKQEERVSSLAKAQWFETIRRPKRTDNGHYIARLLLWLKGVRSPQCNRWIDAVQIGVCGTGFNMPQFSALRHHLQYKLTLSIGDRWRWKFWRTFTNKLPELYRVKRQKNHPLFQFLEIREKGSELLAPLWC